MSDPVPNQPKRSISSIDRALRVLEHLAHSAAAGTPLRDLAADLGMNKASLHHALSTMRARGWVEQDDDSRYRLGPATGLLARWWLDANRMVAELHPVLVGITGRANELTNLGRLTERSIVYLDKVEPERPVRVWSEVGFTSPAVTTALGRAIMGARDVTDAVLPAWLAVAPQADKGLHDRVARELVRVRDDGYAIEEDENERGVSCVGVALAIMGTPTAAISVTMQSDRFSFERAAELAAIVVEEVTAAELPGITIATAP